MGRTAHPVHCVPMDWVYRYRDPERLYLNVTNRCSNSCVFCVRSATPRLGDGLLRGGDEPDLDQLLGAVEARGGADGYREVIWCGFGEPTMRLDLVLGASPVFRAAGAEVRLNTNGHACLIHGHDVLPALGEVVDRVNVSLNAPTAERYVELCRPNPGAANDPPPQPEAFWRAMLDFLARAPRYIGEVGASVVGAVLDGGEIADCRQLARDVAGVSLRVR
jgi:TatD DNase family protein